MNEKGLQRINNGVAKVPQLSPREQEVCDAIATYNQLRAFKLDAIDVLEWKDTLLKLMPNVRTSAITFVIEQMVAGNLEHKHTDGLQNIIRGLKRIRKRDGQWQIIPDYPKPW